VQVQNEIQHRGRRRAEPDKWGDLASFRDAARRCDLAARTRRNVVARTPGIFRRPIMVLHVTQPFRVAPHADRAVRDDDPGIRGGRRETQ